MVDNGRGMKRRRTIRLPHYDYGSPGAYFVTIAVKDRSNLLGRLEANAIILSKAGQIAKECWEQIPDHFSQAELDAFIVMPDHLHGIVWVKDVGASQDNVGARHASPLSKRPRGAAKGSLGAIIGSYKSAVSRKLGEAIWQRNYYERVIRDDRELEEARNYIVFNNHKGAQTDST